MTDKLERIVEMNAERKGDHGVTMRLLVKGPLGATQFVLYTGWHRSAEIRRLWEEHRNDPQLLKVLVAPMPADLGYHWNTPQHTDQDSMTCEYAPSGTCYYDGSGLNAMRVFEMLVSEGIEAVWLELEKFYWYLAKTEE